MILVVKHIPVEGPGTLGIFLERSGYNIRTVELSEGEELPDSLEGIKAVVCLGGPMNVYEEEKYPFLKKEDIFIKHAIINEVPFLGVCLGAQLLAKATGAEVKKASEREIGFFKIRLAEKASGDALFSGIDDEFDVFEWHEDTFDIPYNGALLAGSSICRNQAFRIGKNAYGLQFHVEVNDKMVRDWVEEYSVGQNYLSASEKENIRTFTGDGFEKTAEKLFVNFDKIIRSA